MLSLMRNTDDSRVLRAMEGTVDLQAGQNELPRGRWLFWDFKSKKGLAYPMAGDGDYGQLCGHNSTCILIFIKKTKAIEHSD